MGTLRGAAAAVFMLACLCAAPGARAEEASVARGAYLVGVISCGDCHTPGSFGGKPDMGRMLGGSDVGFAIPGLGVFVGSNLAPDDATGIGKWSVDEIVTAITKGERPDGRQLAPIMPWRSFAGLTPDDARSIALYLKSLKPVSHMVAGPFGPSQAPTVPVMTVLPCPAYVGAMGIKEACAR
jgi:mono/diheme cytochrome c family protein